MHRVLLTSVTSIKVSGKNQFKEKDLEGNLLNQLSFCCWLPLHGPNRFSNLAREEGVEKGSDPQLHLPCPWVKCRVLGEAPDEAGDPRTDKLVSQGDGRKWRSSRSLSQLLIPNMGPGLWPHGAGRIEMVASIWSRIDVGFTSKHCLRAETCMPWGPFQQDRESGHMPPRQLDQVWNPRT